MRTTSKCCHIRQCMSCRPTMQFSVFSLPRLSPRHSLFSSFPLIPPSFPIFLLCAHVHVCVSMPSDISNQKFTSHTGMERPMLFPCPVLCLWIDQTSEGVQETNHPRVSARWFYNIMAFIIIHGKIAITMGIKQNHGYSSLES